MPRSLTTYCVWVDWTGERYQVQPFIEALAGIRSSGSGSFLAIPLHDVSFEFRSSYDAKKAFDRIKAVGCRWSSYIRIRLLVVPPGFGAIWKQLRIYKRGKSPDLTALVHKGPPRRNPSSARNARKPKKVRDGNYIHNYSDRLK